MNYASGRFVWSQFVRERRDDEVNERGAGSLVDCVTFKLVDFPILGEVTDLNLVGWKRNGFLVFFIFRI